MKVKVNIMNRWYILMSEVVTVPSFMMVTSIVFKESPARDRHTQTDPHGLVLSLWKQKHTLPKQINKESWNQRLWKCTLTLSAVTGWIPSSDVIASRCRVLGSGCWDSCARFVQRTNPPYLNVPSPSGFRLLYLFLPGVWIVPRMYRRTNE